MRILAAITLAAIAILAVSIGASKDAAALPSATMPASAPSTAPASRPATAAAAEVTSVRRGTIRLDVRAEGYLEPVGALEVAVEPKVYNGELKIAAIADNGSQVKKGDTLLRLDTAEFDRALASAENDATAAHANLDKATSDVALGEKADALAMAQQQEHQQEAAGSLKWWEKVDGPVLLATSDFATREGDYQLDDATDELNELKKMYKTEELTNATADIVMKRAMRAIELDKTADTIMHEQGDEFVKFQYDILHSQVADASKSTDQQTAQLQAAQAQGATLRQTASFSAKAAADAADRRVAELKADGALLSVAAPADGVALYGQLIDGNWQNNDSRALRIGQAVQPRQVVLTFFTPGKMRGVVDLPEAKFYAVPAGARAAVTPVGLPGAAMIGSCQTSVPQGKVTQAGIIYAMQILLPAADDRLVPGMRTSVLVKATLAQNVMIVPLSAVSGNQVWVRGRDGSEQVKDVVLGASDDTNIEVRSGLADGDAVLTNGKK